VLFRTPPDVRVDTGFSAGDAVSIHYDAMLAKLICHGATREDAVYLLHRALADTDLIGVASDLDLLGRITAHPEFIAGGVDTGFIARHADTLLTAPRNPPPEVLVAAALCVLTDEAGTALAEAAATADPHSPWHASDHWWVNVAFTRELRFLVDEVPHPVSVQAAGDAWRLTMGEHTHCASARRSQDGRLDIVVDGTRTRVSADRHGEATIVRHDGETFSFRLPDPVAAGAEDDDAGGRLVAPIPGQVTQVLAEPGMSVTRGQILVVLEAMKTVFRLAAPADGTVATVPCRAGDSVVEGQLLVGFAEDTS
jgi:3-methylcrotonyl-CoA carboxylase alpha subunit